MDLKVAFCFSLSFSFCFAVFFSPICAHNKCVHSGFFSLSAHHETLSIGYWMIDLLLWTERGGGGRIGFLLISGLGALHHVTWFVDIFCSLVCEVEWFGCWNRTRRNVALPGKWLNRLNKFFLVQDSSLKILSVFLFFLFHGCNA